MTFRTLGEESAVSDFRQLPEYKELTVEAQKQAQEAYDNTFNVRLPHLGMKIASGIANATATALIETLSRGDEDFPSFDRDPKPSAAGVKASKAAWKATEDAKDNQSTIEHMAAAKAHDAAAGHYTHGTSNFMGHAGQAYTHRSIARMANFRINEDEVDDPKTTIDPNHPFYKAGHQFGSKLAKRLHGTVMDPTYHIHTNAVAHSKDTPQRQSTLANKLHMQRHFEAGAHAAFDTEHTVTEAEAVIDRSTPRTPPSVTGPQKCPICKKEVEGHHTWCKVDGKVAHDYCARKKYGK